MQYGWRGPSNQKEIIRNIASQYYYVAGATLSQITGEKQQWLEMRRIEQQQRVQLQTERKKAIINKQLKQDCEKKRCVDSWFVKLPKKHERKKHCDFS